MSQGQYVATRPFPTTHRQYEIGDMIDTSRITSSELNAGVTSGAIVPAKFIDTAARLAALNPVLGPGVHAYETDTGVHKIGTDGVTRYNSLGQVGNATYLQRVPDPTGVAATDAAAIQAAHDALPATGGRITLGTGTYNLGTTTVTLSKPVIMEGCGGPSATWSKCPTQISYTSPTGTAIVMASECVTLRDFGVRYTGGSTPTAGAGIATSGAWPVGHGMRIQDVGVMGFWADFVIDSGAEWWMTNVFAYDPVKYGIVLGDVIDVRLVAPQVIAGPNNLTPDSAFYLTMAGGVTIIGPKVNNRGSGKWKNGIEGSIPDGSGPEDWQFFNGSIEGVSEYGIKLRQAGPSNTGTVDKIQWQGLEIASTGSPSYAAISLVAVTAGAFSGITDGSGNIFYSWSKGFEFTNCARVAI